jgi:hypothetical protein
MEPRKEDCGFLLTALIPPGDVGAAQQAMAEAAPDGTLFGCEYIQEMTPALVADALEAAKHAFRRALEQGKGG